MFQHRRRIDVRFKRQRHLIDRVQSSASSPRPFLLLRRVLFPEQTAQDVDVLPPRLRRRRDVSVLVFIWIQLQRPESRHPDRIRIPRVAFYPLSYRSQRLLRRRRLKPLFPPAVLLVEILLPSRARRAAHAHTALDVDLDRARDPRRPSAFDPEQFHPPAHRARSRVGARRAIPIVRARQRLRSVGRSVVGRGRSTRVRNRVHRVNARPRDARVRVVISLKH